MSDSLYRFQQVAFSSLIGIVFQSVEQVGLDEIHFLRGDNGKSYLMAHDQDCCEDVSIEDVVGELSDLVGSPILFAEESSNSIDPPADSKGDDDSYTWTFYRIGTIKGSVVIRWFGSSNGYYSESVEVYEMAMEEGN